MCLVCFILMFWIKFNGVWFVMVFNLWVKVEWDIFMVLVRVVILKLGLVRLFFMVFIVFFNRSLFSCINLGLGKFILLFK